MERMIVTTFGTDAEAQRGVSALKDLNASGDITLYGVVVLGKDVSGKVTVRLGSGEIVEGTSTGLLTSAMLGLIAGPARMGTDTSLDALSGMLFELSQAGVDVRFAARVSDELRPGTVVVVASADEDWTAPVDTRMAALGGVVFRQPITNVIEDQDARDAAVLSAQSDALKAELEAVGERARSELQKSIDRVKADVRQKEVEIELRVDQAAREADAKLAAVKAQLATANAQTRARLAHRFACVSGSLDARGARLKQAADLVKQARL